MSSKKSCCWTGQCRMTCLTLAVSSRSNCWNPAQVRLRTNCPYPRWHLKFISRQFSHHTWPRSGVHSNTKHRVNCANIESHSDLHSSRGYSLQAGSYFHMSNLHPGRMRKYDHWLFLETWVGPWSGDLVHRLVTVGSDQRFHLHVGFSIALLHEPIEIWTIWLLCH